VIDASGSQNQIIYEQGGYLHLFDLKTSQSHRLTVGISTDLIELRERYARAPAGSGMLICHRPEPEQSLNSGVK